MFENREIIGALEIAKEKHQEIISGLFSKSTILNIVNKIRWSKGASEHEGTFMTESEFEKAIRNRKFFCTQNKIGLK